MKRLAYRVAAFAYPFLEGAHRLYRIGARERALRRFATAGPNLSFDAVTSRIHYETVRVGANVYIGWGAYFLGPIDIGDDVMFGPEVHLRAGYHRFDVVGSTIQAAGADERATIVIEDDVWLGARVSVMKGVRVGEGTVIGTASVVLHDLPPYVVAVGTPCRPVRRRFSDDDLRRHLALRGRSDADTDRVLGARNAVLEPLGL